MASVDLTNKGGIINNGGGILKLSECDANGTLTGTDVTTVGYIEVTERFDETEETPIYDETGAQIVIQQGNRKVGIVATLMQVDKGVLDFLETARNKFFRVYYKASKTSAMNGKTQEVFAAIARIVPSYRFQSNQPKIPVTISFLAVPAQITQSTPNTFWGCVTTTTLTFTAGSYYVISEV